MLDPSTSIAARAALASGIVTLALAALTLLFHGESRRRARERDRRSQELAEVMAGFLTGRLDRTALRAQAGRAPAGVFWGALERFADNVAGEEWTRLSTTLHRLPHVASEERHLLRGPAWRRAIAGRHLGMLDDRELRAPLRLALRRGPGAVRLAALLALARARDMDALHWLLVHPEVVRTLAPHIVVAVFKRFGPAFRDPLRRVIARRQADEAVAVVAAEALGLWKDEGARPLLERLLRHPGMEARIAAARALGHIGASASATALLEALSDPAWQVRAQAARALGHIPRPEVVPRLEQATSDMAWWVRRNACYALAQQDAEGYAALCRISQLGVDRFAREMAIEALQALEWERVSPGGIGRVG